MSSNRKTQPKASNVLIRLHVLKKKQVTPSCFPERLQKAGQVNRAKWERCTAWKKMATKDEPGTKKFEIFSRLFRILTEAKPHMAELLTELEIRKETTVLLPFLQA